MQTDKGNQPKRRSQYTYQAIPHFDINDYVNNPPMVIKLNAEKELALEECRILQKKLEDETKTNQKLKLQKQESELKLEEANRIIVQLQQVQDWAQEESRNLAGQSGTMQLNYHNLELEKQAIQHRLDEATRKLEEASRRSVLKYFVTVVATVMLSFGIGFVTSTQLVSIGWLMIILGGILDFIAFFIALSPKPERATNV